MPTASMNATGIRSFSVNGSMTAIGPEYWKGEHRRRTACAVINGKLALDLLGIATAKEAFVNLVPAYFSGLTSWSTSIRLTTKPRTEQTSANARKTGVGSENITTCCMTSNQHSGINLCITIFLFALILW